MPSFMTSQKKQLVGKTFKSWTQETNKIQYQKHTYIAIMSGQITIVNQTANYNKKLFKCGKSLKPRLKQKNKLFYEIEIPVIAIS